MKKRDQSLTKDKKIARGIQLAVAGKANDLVAIWATNINPVKQSFTPMGDGTERARIQGSFTANFKRHKDNAILKEKSVKFSLEIEDCKDSWGHPDVKVTLFDCKDLD